MTDQKIPGVSSNASRTWMTSLIGLLVVLVIYLATPTQHFSPAGVILPAAHTLPASSPSDVKLMSDLPSGALRLGAVHIEMQYTGNKNATRMEILQKVQQLAASVGGNAVFVRYFDVPPGMFALPSNMIYWNFRGIVYKVDPSLIPMEPSIVIPTQ